MPRAPKLERMDSGQARYDTLKKEPNHGRRRHRIHRPHADRPRRARRLQPHPRRRHGRPRDRARRQARRHRSGRRGGRGDGLRQSRGRHRRQHRPPVRHPRRPAGDGGGPDRQPLLLLGPAGDRARGLQHQGAGRAGGGGGRPRVHQPRADEHEHQVLPQRVDRRAQGRALHAHDRDGRHRRQALRRQPAEAGRVRADEPAAHGRGPEGRTLRRRDRAHDHDHGGREQGDQGDLQAHRHAGEGRGQPPRDEPGGPRQAQARARRRPVHHRRQRQPAVRRRLAPAC